MNTAAPLEVDYLARWRARERLPAKELEHTAEALDQERRYLLGVSQRRLAREGEAQRREREAWAITHAADLEAQAQERAKARRAQEARELERIHAAELEELRRREAWALDSVVIAYAAPGSPRHYGPRRGERPYHPPSPRPGRARARRARESQHLGLNVGGAWIPQAGGLLFPARYEVGARDICDAIREAREVYE